MKDMHGCFHRFLHNRTINQGTEYIKTHPFTSDSDSVENVNATEGTKAFQLNCM